jgi:[ribosomal protein S5]-alanine N-acetyltransferase
MTKLFETNRLTLRTWELADASRMFEICSDAEVMKNIGSGKPYKTLAEAEEFLTWADDYQTINGFCRWAVLEKTSGEIIGSCGFAVLEESNEIDFGYLFARDCWGKGFATEAARECVRFGFKKLNFREIIAITELDNFASQNVLEKIGFKKRGIEILENEEALVYLAENKI